MTLTEAERMQKEWEEEKRQRREGLHDELVGMYAVLVDSGSVPPILKQRKDSLFISAALLVLAQQIQWLMETLEDV